MGISEKIQVEGGLESESKKWVITGIPLRTHLRPINTNPKEKFFDGEDVEAEEEECSTTPTAEESRIPKRFSCPPAPKKKKPTSKCHFSGVREFFSPPDLDSVFIPRVERAK
ncbi:cyclin-dependent protein kinase inhibitor SMR6 [Magnolia sinica]|uniref:cyclin-dependent protein kinase inhibitor SMR6 n=1 Tax=Magnolia sinica TaxID=86752 RepID=UPI0026592DF2|nr:cyclin-dependent protein kinase inhibitor SMR6 [Magnolia sinica]